MLNCLLFQFFLHRNMKKTVKQRQPENERRRRDKRKRNRLSSNSITVMRRRKKVYDNFFSYAEPIKETRLGRKGELGVAEGIPLQR